MIGTLESVLGAIALLGVKSGLLLGSSGLGRSILVIYSLSLGTGLWLLSFLFKDRAATLTVFIDNYTFVGGLLMACLLIYLSLQVPSRSCQGGGARLWGLLPCPFCVLALALMVIMLPLPDGGFALNWGVTVAGVFALLVLAVSLLTRLMAGGLKYATHRLFNGLLFTLGVMTLAFALVTPNVVAVLQVPLEPLEVNALVAGVNLILVMVVVLSGYFIKKRQMGRGC
ncbi:MAG: DUF2162 domain-containing protein [Firmicutes bacterium]|nr:DUF2162 domain-containing protein [Bacillota bacterium]MBU4532840.1 DUF2162 domain-containing protein [Bacillota bacterium]MBU4553985.1 DUF2162 domain-containing protein [Bacillota bacterium]MBV1727595.1 DUF2162 domain-containing protein [Desulforudis sp.]MBV1734408.1 DUF2162 domain-containing protein [Desulforudis sp.]